MCVMVCPRPCPRGRRGAAIPGLARRAMRSGSRRFTCGSTAGTPPPAGFVTRHRPGPRRRHRGDADSTVAAHPKGETVTTEPVSRGHGRRAVLGLIALGAVGTPIAVAQRWAHADTTAGAASGGGMALARAAALPPAASKLRWSPTPSGEGPHALEGLEADRGNKHPGRKYVCVEDDHSRSDIYKDARDTTGGGDRQRTETK